MQLAPSSFYGTIWEGQSISQDDLPKIKNFLIHLSEVTLPFFLKKVLSQLIENEHDWVTLLIGETGESPLAKGLITLIGSENLPEGSTTYKIYQRYLQIIAVKQQIHSLSPTESLRLANCVVRKFPQGFFFTEVYVHPDLHYNFLSKNIYFITATQISICNTKKITAAIQIPFEFTQAVSFVYCTTSRKEQDVPSLRQEAEIHQSLTGSRGIWPLQSVFCYTKQTKNLQQKPKIRLLSTCPETNLELLIKSQIVSMAQRLSILEDLAAGLEQMHASAIAHGSICCQNVVICQKAEEQIEAWWINFESSQQLSHFSRTLPLNSYYGSPLYTPPELLGVDTFDGDLFKLDIWAFGQLIHELVSLSTTPWTIPLTAQLNNPDLSIMTTKDLHSWFVITHVERLLPFFAKQKKSASLGIEQELLLLSYKMLKIDVHLRPNITEVKTEITRIKHLIN